MSKLKDFFNTIRRKSKEGKVYFGISASETAQVHCMKLGCSAGPQLPV